MVSQQSKGFAPHDLVDDLITVNAVHGSFYGSVMPAAAIEGLIAAHVPRKHIQEVPNVYETKWWDYRRLSPGHSFLLFAHTYYKQFKFGARTFLNYHKRSGKFGGKGGLATGGAGLIGPGEIQFTSDQIWERDKGHITSMWLAMLVCDAVGMPYEEYFKIANALAIELRWTRIPTPNQLYAKNLLPRVTDEWVSLSKDKLFHAKHPLYLVENYIGLDVQDEYRKAMIAEIERRDNPVHAITKLVFQYPQIPEDLAEQNFPHSVMKRARLLAV